MDLWILWEGKALIDANPLVEIECEDSLIVNDFRDNETVTVSVKSKPTQDSKIPSEVVVSLSKVDAASDSDAPTDWVSDTDSEDDSLSEVDAASDSDAPTIGFLIQILKVSLSGWRRFCFEIPRIGIPKRTLRRTHWVKLTLPILRCLRLGFWYRTWNRLTQGDRVLTLTRHGLSFWYRFWTDLTQGWCLFWTPGSAYWLGFDTDSEGLIEQLTILLDSEVLTDCLWYRFWKQTHSREVDASPDSGKCLQIELSDAPLKLIVQGARCFFRLWCAYGLSFWHRLQKMTHPRK